MLSEFLSIRGILVLILTIIGILLTFRNPKFGLIAFIILLFSRAGFLIVEFPVIYKVFHLPKFFGILTLVSVLIHSKKCPIRLPFEFWLMLLFFFIICLSRQLADTGIFTNKVPEEFLKMCVLFFLIVNTIRNEKDIKQVIWLLIIINTIFTLYHYYHYKTGWRSIFIVWNYQGLTHGEFAAMLTSACPLAYIFLRNEEYKPIIRILLWFCLFTFVFGVILTYSRGGLIALSITLFLAILQDKQKIKPILFFLIVGLLISNKISEHYINRMKTITYMEQDVSTMGRIATNYAALNMIKAHPLFGVGAGNFNNTFISYTPENLKQYVREGKSIHNFFLQVASETGLIGLLIFSLLIIKPFFEVIKLRKLFLKHEKMKSLAYIATSLGLALFGYCISGQFFPGAYYSYLYIFLPLIVCTYQVALTHG